MASNPARATPLWRYPGDISMHTNSKFEALTKFWVTATVTSKFRTQCHHPLGTNIVSPGNWVHSMGLSSSAKRG